MFQVFKIFILAKPLVTEISSCKFYDGYVYCSEFSKRI